MDLGDNYPRGINLHKFDQGGTSNRVVYHFKTLHGETPANPAGTQYPVYHEISVGGKTFYQWSNDNKGYTELAHSGIVEVADGYLIFFCGESPSLDNSKTGDYMNVPRNAGYVKVPKDLSSKEVLSGTNKEKGGFYTFNGVWAEQDNEGVHFYTQYTSMDQSVTRMKTARLGTNKIL